MPNVKIQFKTKVNDSGKPEAAGKSFTMEEELAMKHVSAGRAVLIKKDENQKAADDAAKAAKEAEKAAKEKAEKEAAQKAADDAAKAKGQQ